MTDAIQKAKLKTPYIDWRNRPYASGNDQKKKQAEAFDAMNAFVRKHGGSIVSPPGNKTLRVEVPKGSELPAKLAELHFNVARCGSVTRITGAPSITAKVERETGVVPSAFLEMDVLEIRLDGK
jgi:hypothetical protein